MDFKKFDKIPRLSREMVVTEKVDGTNAQIVIINREDLIKALSEQNEQLDPYALTTEFIREYSLFFKGSSEANAVYIFAGSRKRWINPNSDNFGFAKWVKENAEELLKLGEGRHYGEWYGCGIQRDYGLDEKRFALFNVKHWASRKVIINGEVFERNTLKENDARKIVPKCCGVVPILYEGLFDTLVIEGIIEDLRQSGSKIVSGFMKPEGIVIYHKAAGKLFKKTLENDEKPKGK